MQKESTEKNGATPGVSVVVCAHDEEANLRALVPLLLQQQYPDFEVVVVNDRSNDGTYDYLRELALIEPHLKVLQVDAKPDHINGKKFGLTLAIKAAKHEWVLFTDADCRPASNNWLAEMASAMGPNTNFVLGYSPYQKSNGLLNAFIRFETETTALQYLGLGQVGMPYMGVGRNLAYRKSMFLNNKGFNNILSITGGDDDLLVNAWANAKNTRVVLTPHAITLSKPKTTWQAFFEQKRRHLSVGKFYKRTHKLVLGIFSLTWMAFWPMAVALTLLGGWKVAAGGLLVRLITQTGAFQALHRRAGQGLELPKTPFLDFIFGFYYLVAGIAALNSKKIRWKT